MEDRIEIIRATERLLNMTSRFDGELVVEHGVLDGEFRATQTEPTHVLLHYVSGSAIYSQSRVVPV